MTKGSGSLEPTRNEALAAVIVPYGLMKAGFNFAIVSGDEGRMPLSFSTGSGTSVNIKSNY